MSVSPRRTVTGHDAAGRSVLLLDDGSDHPVEMMFVLIDAAITDQLRAATGPLEFFDQVLG
jgi:hypothetical protein